MLVLSLIPRGSPQYVRYLLANQSHQVWTGHDWSEVESDGLLFADLKEVGRVCASILKSHAEGKNLYLFSVPVLIEIRSDQPPRPADVQLWLMRAVQLVVDYAACGSGPLADSTAVLTLQISGLQQIEE